jgi:hypothetical protein
MATRHRKTPASTALKAAELAYAVPQVVAHRLARMALAGPILSPRDRKEFKGMVAEKQTAFWQSWQGMFNEALRINRGLAVEAAKSMMFDPWGLQKKTTPLRAARKASSTVLKIAGKGLDPVHSKATANAKRLARTRLTK